MPGLEDSGNRAVVVPNQPLVTSAAPVVEPNAVNALVDSFHRGVISADDIISRIGEVGQAKKKLELDLTNAAVRQAPLVERATQAKLARSAQSDESLGESEKLAASFQSANLPLPKTPEGFVDVAAARSTQNEINQWQAEILRAQIRNAHIKYETRTYENGAQKLEPFSESDGRFLTDTELGEVKRLAEHPPSFADWKKSQLSMQPGLPQPSSQPQTQSQAEPDIELSPTAAAEVARRRAALVNHGASVAEALKLSNRQILDLQIDPGDIGTVPVITPKTTTATTKPTVLPTAPAAGTSTATATAPMAPNQLKAGGEDQTKLEHDYRTELMREFSSRSGPFGIEDSKVNQAIHLLALFDQYKDPKTGEYKVPRVQQNELALGLARLISPSGQVGIELMRELNQKTAQGDLAGVITYFTGKPVTGTSQEILRMFKDSIERQGLVAEQNRQAYFEGLRALAPTDLSQDRRDKVEQSLKLNSVSAKLGVSPTAATTTPTAPAGTAKRVVIPGIGPGSIGPDGKFYPDK